MMQRRRNWHTWLAVIGPVMGSADSDVVDLLPRGRARCFLLVSFQITKLGGVVLGVTWHLSKLASMK
ncbi:hypothetical protein ACFX15_007259 [Malus domestica]